MADDSIGKLIVRLLLDDSQFQDGKKRAGKSLFDLGSVFDRAAKQIERGFITSMKAATAASAAFGAASTVVGAGFEKQMQRVAAISGIVDRTSDSYAKLEEKAREIGATTAFTAREAATGIEILAQAGLGLRNTLDAADSAVRFAGANSVTMEQSVNLLAATLQQFNLAGAEAGRVADVFGEATRSSLFTVESLTEAMKYAGTTGAGLGMSLEETTAAVAQFRDLGLEGSLAGTNFRMAMAAISKPTQEAERALARYGLTAEDVNPELRSFRDIMISVGQAGISTADAIEIFGLRSGNNVKMIANAMASSSEEFDALLAKLRTSSGVTEEMYGTMMDSVWGSFATLLSAMEEGLLRMFDQFRELTEFVNAAIGVVGKVNEAISRNSSEISRRFGMVFGQLTAWLNESGDLISRFVIEWTELVLDLTGAVTSMLPLLTGIIEHIDSIAIAAASLWAALRTMQIARWVAAITAQILAAESATAALGTTIKLATGGWVGLAAGAAVALGGLGYALYRARTQSEALSEQMERGQKKVLKEVEEEQQRYTDALTEHVEQAKKATLAMALEAESAGKLTTAIRGIREEVERLNTGDLSQKVASGDLLLVGDQLKTLETVMREATAPGMTALSEHMMQLQTQANGARERFQGLAKVMEELQLGTSAALAQSKGSTPDDALPYILGGRFKSMGELQGALDEAKRQLDATEAEIGSYQQRIQGVRAKLEGERVEAEARADEQDKLRRQQRQEKALADQQTANERLLALQRQLEDARVSVSDDALDKLRLDHQRFSADIQDAYQEAFQAYAGDEQKRRELGKEMLDARWQANQVFLQRRKEILDQQAAEEDAKAKKARDQRISYAKQIASETQDALNEGFEKRKAVEDQVSALEGRNQRRVRESVRLRREAQDEINRMIQEGVATEEQIARAKAAYRKQITKASTREAAEGFRQFASTVSRIGQVVMRDIAGFVTGVVNSISGAINRVGEMMTKLTGMGVNIRGGVQAAVSGVEERRTAALEAGQSFTRKDAASAASTAGGTAVDDMASKARRAVTVVADAMPTVLDRLTAQLPVVIDTAIQQLPRIFDALAAQLPRLVGMLAQQLPSLVTVALQGLQQVVTGLIQMLPQIVTGIISVLPQLLQGLVQVALQLVDALIAELPRLIIALVEQIPVLIKQIMAALPTLIQGLIAGVSDVIVAVVNQLPTIVQNIVTQLPTIITALIDGLVNSIGPIVEALATAIPDLLKVVLEGLPDIVISLVRGIVDAIPVIMDALINSLPDLVMNLVKFIIQDIPRIVFKFVVKIIQELPNIVIRLFQLIFLKIPQLVFKMVVGLARGIVEALVAFFRNIFAPNWEKNREKREARRQERLDKRTERREKRGWESPSDFEFAEPDGGSFYSGIPYVPRRMTATLHEGEAVMPAHQNPNRSSGSDNMPAAGSSASRASSAPSMPMVLQVILDGRVVNEALVHADRNGTGGYIQQVARRIAMAGGSVGIDAGPFNKLTTG